MSWLHLRAYACALPFLLSCGRGSPPPERAVDSTPASDTVAPAQAPAAAAPAPTVTGGTDSLARAFRLAHERRDVPALLALFDAECATPEIRALTERTLRSHLDDSIQAVRIEPPMPNRVTSYEREGKRYALNLPLQGELVVVYDTVSGRRSSYPIGASGGGARLATMCAR